MKIFASFLILLFVFSASAQEQRLNRDFALKTGGAVEIKNLYGKVIVAAEDTTADKVFLSVESPKSIAESEIKTSAENGRVTISVVPKDAKTRIDLTVKIPLRSRVSVETNEGEVRIAGNVAAASVTTETGTISTDVPLGAVKFDFAWTASRPRYLSDAALPNEVKEKSGGRFVLSGKLGEADKSKKEKVKRQNEEPDASEETADNSDETKGENGEDKSFKNKKPKKEDKTIELNFTTARGIVLLNVNPNDVPTNLQERPLTEAAKAIVRSGDSLLTEAIRRASPKYFGDYLKTLPPRRREPELTSRPKSANETVSKIRQVLVKVTDENNRAVSGLQKSDFTVTEAGQEREILSVEQSTAPFNLVLLLDVSGSVNNSVDFIRKAARQFVNTMRPDDKIAIVIFNEDVKQISTFTTNRRMLSESLDTFDAGGGTAYYDAIAYTLVETLRPLKGERTAIVALTDGDDNRSFLPFDSLLGSIQESGALIYPLYVPSALIAASKTNDAEQSEDLLRSRYMALTSKAETEGARLAEVSGGVYYPIKRLSDLQKAYEDIAVQLRTAYTLTFRSDSLETNERGASPRLKIKVNRPNSFVSLGTVKEISESRVQSLKSKVQNSKVAFQVPRYGVQVLNSKFRVGNPLTLDSGLWTLDTIEQTNDITGEIENIKYKQVVAKDLREYDFENFKINNSTGSFLLSDGQNKIAVSRWISPKRTRSYPYERVYNTLAFPRCAAIIPVVKDEGLGGERDFLQWDTISFLSLLDVYLIPAYYSDAVKNAKRGDQITAQKLDENYVNGKLKEIFAFKGSAREWNEKEVKNLSDIFEKSRAAYAAISKNTGTYLHDDAALVQLIKLTMNPNDFAEFSRGKAERAQNRETQSIQPKEALATDTKGKVTITNLAGGKYFFTCDETLVDKNSLFLIEDKHSQRAHLPSENDIKDGLLKMIIYTNLRNVRVGGNSVLQKPVLKLTSTKMVGAINSNSNEPDTVKFFEANLFDIPTRNFLQKLFAEARENNFTIKLEKGEIGQNEN
ncbi:MAG: VWA domain-containing protein [Pyrinomonadaceae bacterium]